MNPNQFMHQNQILGGVGTSSHINIVKKLILMHKLIQIQSVS